MANEKGTVVLVAFYNVKALGVRYLETALTKAGYRVVNIFFKGFNSANPSLCTERELQLLCDKVESQKPILVGLSVMSSMYLESIHMVIEALQKRGLGPLVCGGAYASMFPDHFLERDIPFTIRMDGEIPLVALADALRTGSDWHNIPSLCYRENGENVLNPIDGMLPDVDAYGIPTVNSPNACSIENDTLTEGDPQLGTLSYEVIASRGCPYTCSYCCCVNLRRLYPKGVKPVRTRSVKSVIDELIEAKRHCKKITFFHFYDEIFPNLPGWVDEFVKEYKEHIHMPFTIWSHPKMMDEEMLRKLKSVGLMEVIMGIQTGSKHIREDVFHRYETSDDVEHATKMIADAGIFWGTYDFMLQHPFESVEDLKDSYRLAKRLHGRFELQLHGLNFLPGTDIIPMAIEAGYFTPEEMDKVMYAPMADQFKAFWKQPNSQESQLWYDLIYLWQFKSYRKKCLKWEQDVFANEKAILAAYQKTHWLHKLRYIYKKAYIVARSMVLRLG